MSRSNERALKLHDPIGAAWTIDPDRDL